MAALSDDMTAAEMAAWKVAHLADNWAATMVVGSAGMMVVLLAVSLVGS